MNTQRLLAELGFGLGFAALCAVASWFVWEPLLRTLAAGQELMLTGPKDLLHFKLRHSAAVATPAIMGTVLILAAHIRGGAPAAPLRAAGLLTWPWLFFAGGVALTWTRLSVMLADPGPLSVGLSLSTLKLASPGLAWCLFASFVGLGWVAMKGGRRPETHGVGSGQ